MTFDSIDSAWWPYLFILVAAALPTMMWRWAAVFFASDLDADSEWLVLVRCISTALVAAVVSQLIVFPTEALQTVPLAYRIGAAVLGFGVFLKTDNLLAGILAGEATIIIAYLAFAA